MAVSNRPDNNGVSAPSNRRNRPDARRDTPDSASVLRWFNFGGDKQPLRFIQHVFFFLFCILTIRFIWVQLIDAPRIRQEGQVQRLSEHVLYAKRGRILDRNGNVLAMSVDCKAVCVNPSQINTPYAYAKMFAHYLGGDPETYVKKIKSGKTFAYIDRQVPMEKANQLMDYVVKKQLSGVYTEYSSMRQYPYGATGCQVLGRVDLDGKGVSGLELQYDKILSGKNGTQAIEIGKNGVPIAGGIHKVEPARNGTDIVVSLDINTQQMAEANISSAVKEYEADSGSVMVTDPHTGEVLALCSTPLADFSSGHFDPVSLQLKPISNSYEPGSIFKVLTMAIALEDKVLTPETSLTVPPTYKLGTATVSDDDQRGYTMEMTPGEILRRSSNVGALLVGRRIGTEKFYDGIQNFGIGQRTGIDFPGEVKGLVAPKDQWDITRVSFAAFGQGIAMPMVQMVRAVGAIANEGVMTTPHFLIAKGDAMANWPAGQRVCSKRTAEEVTSMMRLVVNRGTAENAQVKGFDIAGKTGTGEMASETGGYQAHKYMSSLIGFGNAENPDVLVYVGLNGTPYLAHGSVANTFSQIMREALVDMGTKPYSTENSNG